MAGSPLLLFCKSLLERQEALPCPPSYSMMPSAGGQDSLAVVASTVE